MSAEFENIKDEATIKAQKARQYVLEGFKIFNFVPKFFPPTQGLVKKPFPEGVDTFGNFVFTDITFEPGQYNDLQGGGVISYDGLTVQSALMEVNMSKNIVLNQVAGRNGTVKTYVNDGDFQVSVRGALTVEDQLLSPKVDAEVLSRWFTVPRTVQVTSDFLLSFSSISPSGVEGISDVVVVDFSFQQLEGFRNVLLFQCNLLSDAPIELTIDSETV